MASPRDRRLFAQALPDEPRPVRLMNTIWADRWSTHDGLETARDLRAWLGQAGFRVGAIGRQDVSSARRLRDALRMVGASVAGRPDLPYDSPLFSDALEVINDLARSCPPFPRLIERRGALTLETAVEGAGVRSALSQLAVEAMPLLCGEAPPLRACRAPGCILFFVNGHTRRQWCSTACGNRVRAARHYRRRTEE